MGVPSQAGAAHRCAGAGAQAHAQAHGAAPQADARTTQLSCLQENLQELAGKSAVLVCAAAAVAGRRGLQQNQGLVWFGLLA